MIEPKEIEVHGKTFIISKFPAIEGREIIAVYLSSSIPKYGNYKVNEETMLKLMSYVSVPMTNIPPLPLTTRALVNNHAGNWETLGKIEVAMMEYNCSFLQNGRVSTFLNDTAQKLPMWISKTLTLLLAQLSQTEKPH